MVFPYSYTQNSLFSLPDERRIDMARHSRNPTGGLDGIHGMNRMERSNADRSG